MIIQEEESQNKKKSVRKMFSVKLKMTDFRKEFALSPEIKKKSQRKSSPENDDEEFDFNDITSRQKSQSMKFKEVAPKVKKTTRANRFQNFELSKIEESECETYGQESSEYFKITESSIGLDTEAEFKGKARPSIETQDSQQSEENEQSGSSSKPPIQNETLQKVFNDLTHSNGIEKSSSIRRSKVGEMPQKVPAESYKKECLKKYRPKITLRTSHVWLHHVKGDGKIRSMLKNFSSNRKMSTDAQKSRKHPATEMPQMQYKNDLWHLLDICEQFREKKLNEISGNEFVQYLSVPGIKKIQRLLKEIKQQIIHVRRARMQTDMTLEDQQSLISKINVLALDLKAAIDK